MSIDPHRVSVRFTDGLLVERDVSAHSKAFSSKEVAAYTVVKILQENSGGRKDWLDEMVTEVVRLKTRHVPAD